jgi:hypothetical protein
MRIIRIVAAEVCEFCNRVAIVLNVSKSHANNKYELITYCYLNINVHLSAVTEKWDSQSVSNL